jgi:hypothetical protein
MDGRREIGQRGSMLTTRTTRPTGSGWQAVIAGGCVAYACVASFTHPFTVTADVVTGLACAAGAAIVVARWRVHRAPALPVLAAVTGGATPRWAWVFSVGAVLVVLSWELAMLFSSPRFDHPTLSSLLDMLDASRPGKAVAFALWLALGSLVLR